MRECSLPSIPGFVCFGRGCCLAWGWGTLRDFEPQHYETVNTEASYLCTSQKFYISKVQRMWVKHPCSEYAVNIVLETGSIFKLPALNLKFSIAIVWRLYRLQKTKFLISIRGEKLHLNSKIHWKTSLFYDSPVSWGGECYGATQPCRTSFHLTHGIVHCILMCLWNASPQLEHPSHSTLVMVAALQLNAMPGVPA